MAAPTDDEVLQREIEYHEKLYAGFAQQHFAKPAVRALRAHLVSRILQRTGANSSSSVLSIGCGIGDTELLLAPRVGRITGVDLSPAAIQQARLDADAAGVSNAQFMAGTIEEALKEQTAQFDVVIAIFFLHHLPETQLCTFAGQMRDLLRPNGCFYSLDPNRYRLSGAIGSLLCPKLMARYQTPDERQLVPSDTAALFSKSGLASQYHFHDFVSSPLAGLFPGWRTGYRAGRALDNVLIRMPLVRSIGSNFEIVAKKT
jgi:2-polyprenyl-3-methyl-5-hydroxy-6-metoxy-1,4-benzoquinol methylase